MSEPFGSFGWICRHAPLPQCNLFFAQLYNQNAFQVLFPSSSEFFSEYNVTSDTSKEDLPVRNAYLDSGTGIGANCEIARAGRRGSVSDIALIVLSVFSLGLTIFLIHKASKRKAAVGRSELRILLIAFATQIAFQAVTMSSILQQGSTALSVLSAIHVSVVVSLFWILLANALVATQVVEDGTPASLVPLSVIAILFFAPTLYITLDTSMSWTRVFRIGVDTDIKGITLFVLTLLWPALAAVLYTIIMVWVVFFRLTEVKPATFAIFAGSQAIFFLVAQPLCDASNGRINSSFISTILNTCSVGIIYLAWRAITEDDWAPEAQMGQW